MRVRAAVRRADRGGREREATETSSEEAGISTPEPDEDPTAKARLGERLAPAEPEEPGEAAAQGHQPVQHVGEDEMPRVRLTRRQLLAFGLFAVSIVAFLYLVLPKLAGVSQDVKRIEKGDKWWVAIGVAFEVVSFAGYVVLFRTVFARGVTQISWRVSYQITMAGLVATRLFAAGGAGGIALTAWALRRSGMAPRLVACRMVAFMVLLYAVYAGSLLIDGVALATGAFPGGGSFAITVVPAIAGFVLFVSRARSRCCPRTSSGGCTAGRRAPAGWLTCSPKPWRPPRWPPAGCAPRWT